MGTIYEFRCNCGYKIEVAVGYVGFCNLKITNENKDNYREEIFYDDLQKFFAAHPYGRIIHTKNYLAHCVACGEYEIFKGWSMCFDNKKIPVLFKSSCHNCGGTLELFSEEEIESQAFYCPKCRAELAKIFAGIWD